MNIAASLQAAQIDDLPSFFFYIPNFITAGEADALQSSIDSQRWIELTHRRLQVYPAQLTSKNVLLSSQSLPQWITTPIAGKFSDLGLFQSSPHRQCNHVLINRYRPGEGIMPHEDGSAYAPITATLSLGAPIVLDIYEKTTVGQRASEPRWRILQEERSLLVTMGDAYSGLIHGIADRTVDEDLGERSIANWGLLGDAERFMSGQVERRVRTSLTCRDVIKVSALGNRLFKNK